MKQNLKSADQPPAIRTLLVILAGLMLFPAAASAQGEAPDEVVRGDRAWARRAEGHQGSQARAEPIQAAIDAYARALDADPDNLDARWKLLRAFHFKGEFVLKDDKARLELFKQGREIAENGVAQIERDYHLRTGMFNMKPAEVAKAVGGQPAVAGFCFWAAANWGLWGQYSGKVISALMGVVNKLRQFAEIMVLMDDSIEAGGGHRLLGHFNARVPRIPIFTWWVDRELAIRELRLSLEVAPGNLLSQVFLAEALLKFRPEEKPEALDLLRGILASAPHPDRLVEDSRVIEDSRELLAANLR